MQWLMLVWSSLKYSSASTFRRGIASLVFAAATVGPASAAQPATSTDAAASAASSASDRRRVSAVQERLNIVEAKCTTAENALIREREQRTILVEEQKKKNAVVQDLEGKVSFLMAQV